MKLLTLALLFVPSVFAQTIPCIPQPAPPPVNAAAGRGPGRGPTPGRTPTPQSAADAAEIGKLMDLPVWGQNLADGDYSHGPAYPTAPELAKRTGVPEGKVIEF